MAFTAESLQLVTTWRIDYSVGQSRWTVISTVMTVQPRRRASGYGDWAVTLPWFHPLREIFHPTQLSARHRARIPMSARITVWDHRRRLAIFVRLLYHANSFQCVWQSRLRSSILHFSCGELPIHLHQSCCSINQLGFCYKDLDQILTELYRIQPLKFIRLHCQSNPNTWSDWHPDF
jgi:hypothetical protein